MIHFHNFFIVVVLTYGVTHRNGKHRHANAKPANLGTPQQQWRQPWAFNTKREASKKMGGQAGFCANVTKKWSVNTEEKITDEDCEEEIMIAKTGSESAAGPHTGGKEG